jgi:hypothetical protein
MLKGVLSGDVCIVEYDKELISYWYKQISDTKGPFKALDAASFTGFDTICKRSDLLIELGTYGYARVTDLEEGFSLKLHAAFWSSETFKKLFEIKTAILSLMYNYDVHRVEVIIPSVCKSLDKLLIKLGFNREGTLHSHGRAGNVIYDENIYSIIRR